MSSDIHRLIHSYFDDSLTVEEHTTLIAWIKSDISHAGEFAQLALLHDQLHNALARPEQTEVTQSSSNRLNRWLRLPFALATISAVLVLGLFLWQLLATKHVAAASIEIKRVIAASARMQDRTYEISVEETAPPDRQGHVGETDRPPKPSIHRAKLSVRGPNQFVLQRQLGGGKLFITGSNGKNSWAVRPEGPVRVSPDLTRFNRDVPGHEHAMSLNNLHEGLEQLASAYDIQVMSVEESMPEGSSKSESSRLLVAIKKRGKRGPRRVEITYAAESGDIHHMRFIDMPYGPERITIRMTLLDEGSLGPRFFDHEAHHDPTQSVELEE